MVGGAARCGGNPTASPAARPRLRIERKESPEKLDESVSVGLVLAWGAGRGEEGDVLGGQWGCCAGAPRGQLDQTEESSQSETAEGEGRGACSYHSMI